MVQYIRREISILDVHRLPKDDKRLETLFPGIPKRREQIRKEMEDEAWNEKR